MPSSHHNAAVRRDRLIDFFHDLITIRGEFLVYDDGYKRRGHSYAAVGRAARGFAARLKAAGLTKDDKVIFWGENRPEWIACYWGCVISGVVVVPIDYRSSPDFVEKVRGIVEAKVLLVGEDTACRSEWNADRRWLLWKFSDLDWHADGPMPDAAISRD